MALTDEDREALCICAEAAHDDRTETETISLCNAHCDGVEAIVARHVEAALSAAADELLSATHERAHREVCAHEHRSDRTSAHVALDVAANWLHALAITGRPPRREQRP